MSEEKELSNAQLLMGSLGMIMLGAALALTGDGWKLETLPITVPQVGWIFCIFGIGGAGLSVFLMIRDRGNSR